MSGLLSAHPCEKCGMRVFTATVQFDGDRIQLDATPVVGGDITMWPHGNLYSMKWLCRARPASVPPPRAWKRMCNWDGEAAADAREWFVKHVHGKTAAEIVEQRKQARTNP